MFFVADKFSLHKTLGELILIDRVTNMTSACGVVEAVDEKVESNERASFVNGELTARGDIFEECCYFYGDGVTQDYDEALKFFKKAHSIKPDNWIHDMLGRCYFYGNGVSQDYDEALKWYKKAGAAENIEDKAQELDKLEEYRTALAYRFSAVEADSEYNISLSNIGWHYYYGYGVDIDYKKAFEYFEKAYIVKKDGWVCNKLGECYEYGRGVATNIEKAKDYYKQGRK